MIKESYQHIPPAVILEVREHPKDMLKAGAIGINCAIGSWNSPFSFKVVIVLKKDGKIRFCIATES